MAFDMRPYLVIPKLIEQPTWGGTYIMEAKHWEEKPELIGKKIGQSYELYAKSNLSLAGSSLDPSFAGELADPKLVGTQTEVLNSVKLADLIAEDPKGVLGADIADRYENAMPLLLKFTQALGNSFQLHIKDGLTDARWKPKPESWYYFEPGVITLGVKPETDWKVYQDEITTLHAQITAIAQSVQEQKKSFEIAKKEIDILVKATDPWKYVNVLPVHGETLIDLSPCGIHHSWEEDLEKAPLGNIVYEIQLDVMDDVSTIRNFDKGKMDPTGKIRPLQIEDYYKFIDRTPEANNPETHMRKAMMMEENESMTHERLLESKYYSMDKVKFKKIGAQFSKSIDAFQHVFVKTGSVVLFAASISLTITAGHAAFIPAGVKEYMLTSQEENTQILLSYS